MRAKPSPATKPRRKRRRVDGNALNELLLIFIRHKDQQTMQREAQQAANGGMTRQQLHNLHTTLKVVTIPMLYQWAVSQGFRGSAVLRVLEDYWEQGGSIERARKCQACLP